jgi:hypothetical protein
MNAYGKQLESVITVPTSSALLTIDTRDSYQFEDGYISPNYTNPYNIQIYKNESIFQGKITRLALQEVNMIYSIPNVNPYNNVLYISGSTGPGVSTAYPEQAIAVQTNFYTPAGLANTLQNELNTATTVGAGSTGLFGVDSWQVQYNLAESSFIIGNGQTGPTGPCVPFNINPKYGQDKGQYANPGERTPYKRTDTLATMMGYGNVANEFTPNPDFIVNPNSGVTGDADHITSLRGDVASMLYTTYIDVVSQTLTQNQKVRDVSTNNKTGSNLLARIYISKDLQELVPVSFDYTTAPAFPNNPAPDNINIGDTTLNIKPFYINYQPSYVKQVRWNDSIFLSSLNIRLQDDKGNLLYDFERQYSKPGEFNFYRAGSNAYAQLTFLISESTD